MCDLHIIAVSRLRPTEESMQTDVKDRALRDAAEGLTKAIRALWDVGERELGEEAFALANRVLGARRGLQPPPSRPIPRGDY